ncbi:MAG: alpha/beta fold hydrolase [Acetobacteraceae bacterium]
MPLMLSNHPRPPPTQVSRRRVLAASLMAALLLGGCAVRLVPAGTAIDTPARTEGAFVMEDGTKLDYRLWRPVGEPRAVILALHGMNDSRDAWEVPGPAFAADGIEIISPDQRGFGATAARGYWPGTATLIADARAMVGLVRAAHPESKLYVMGESMGGAVAICLAASADPPPIDGTILVSPAIWGRKEMNIFERASLWLMDRTLPGLRLTGSIVKVTASDNRAAIRRLSTDPLTLHATRVDAIKGLVDLMDTALADAPRMRGPTLFLYGGKDDLIPKRAAAAAWERLPMGARTAFYPDAYHLMLRDLARATPIGDVIAWIDDPAAPLPSGAGARGRLWLTQQGQKEAPAHPLLEAAR